MYFSESEIAILNHALDSTNHHDRKEFFLTNLRLRKREHNIWEDTPLAKLFTPSGEWHLLSARAKLEKISATIKKAIHKRAAIFFNPFVLFDDRDILKEGCLSHDQMLEVMGAMKLDFSAQEYHQILTLFPKDERGKISRFAFQTTLCIPCSEDIENIQLHLQKDSPRNYWICPNDTFRNSLYSDYCEVCGHLQPAVPGPNQWACVDCGLFNNKEIFFCAACAKACEDSNSF